MRWIVCGYLCDYLFNTCLPHSALSSMKKRSMSAAYHLHMAGRCWTQPSLEWIHALPASPGSSVVKKPPMQEMQGTWVWSLCWDDPLEKEMATYSSILAWENLWTEEPGGLQSMGSQRVEYKLVTKQQQIQSVIEEVFPFIPTKSIMAKVNWLSFTEVWSLRRQQWWHKASASIRTGPLQVC